MTSLSEDLKLPPGISSPIEIFKVLADGIPEIVWIMRADGRVEYFNQEWTKYTGLPQTAASPEDWERVTHPEDFKRNMEVHRSAVANHTPIEREFRLRGSDGIYRWFVARSRAVWSPDGKLFGRFGIASNIDAVKRAREDLEELADSIPQIVWSMEPSGEVYYNRKWWEYTGLGRSQNRAEYAFAAVHPEDQERLAAIWRASNEKNEGWEAEYRLRRHDGVYRWHLGRLLSVQHSEGKPVKRYGTATDIDEQHRLFSELKRLETELRASVEIRDQFLAICSHELKTPLTLLKAHAESFRRKHLHDSASAPGPENLQRYFDRLDGHLRRLDHRINDMLDVSRIATGRLELRFENVELTKLTRAAVENLGPQLANAGCEVTFVETGPVHCVCDPIRIEQVITNLVENALKYGRGKPIQIRVSESTDVVTLEIRDEGIGIVPADQSRIFGQFERSANGASVPGLGLGLYIVSEIVTAHGGKISVESELDRGARFTVTLLKRN